MVSGAHKLCDISKRTQLEFLAEVELKVSCTTMRLMLLLLATCVTAQRDSFNNLGSGRDGNPVFNSNNAFGNNDPFARENQFTPNFTTLIGPQNRDYSINQRRNNFNINRDYGSGSRDFSNFQNPGDNDVYQNPQSDERKCPPEWELYNQNCYRFVRSPVHTREGARLNCQAYGNGSTLLNLNSLNEHSWIVRRLSALDPQRRKWYISARQEGGGSWVNEDQSLLINLDQAFLPDQPSANLNSNNRYLVYSYSDRRNRWGLLRVPGSENSVYICEYPLHLVPLRSDERNFEYGLEIIDRKKIPRGPYFMKQPVPAVFDLSRNIRRPFVSLNCLAGGWPSPQYDWFKEEYLNSSLIYTKIDPLRESKYTLSGGTLFIDTPMQIDRGNYHCVARNRFGAIVSETVSISFGSISEFILTRSTDQAKQYWGKSIFCDAPQHFPGVYYLWARKYFPNLVEEDQRVFVSYDGNLYISAVDMSDQDTYSCNVQSKVSPTGRNGPFFKLQVTPNANYQQLKFADYFPKVFPDSPRADEEIRLECVAFGYPVPSYNWTRKGGSLPKDTVLSNYNRVLTIPKAKVEDQGEYSCRATNSRLSIEQSVTLSIQASPVFTIELGDRHVDKESDLTWICEAFGIPDVNYQWYRNGVPLIVRELPPVDIGRYIIQDNVLTIRHLDTRDEGMYQCRANNSLAAKFSSGQLRVLYLRPSFKKHPVDAELLGAEGGNVTIQCRPEAAPRPTFRWMKDGNFIGTGGRRRILPNGSLLINPVSREDEGYFTCVASNRLGTAESTGHLSVLRGPHLVNNLEGPRQYTVGSTLQMFCRAEAEPKLDVAYIWKHNGIRIDRSYRTKLDTGTGHLEIYNLTLADKGDYECEVLTWVGHLRSVTSVEIIGPPGAPGGVEASDVDSTSARIRWTDGAMNGSPAYLFTIEGRTQWDSRWRTLLENATAEVDDRLSIRETGRKVIHVRGILSPWSAYEFRVIAANDYGYGPPSPPSPQYNTAPNKPFVVPSKIGGGGGKTGSLTITWDPLPPQEQNAPGIHYKVYWRLHHDNMKQEFQSKLLEDWGNIGMYVVQIPTKYYYLPYDVKVQAFNSEGPGPNATESVQIYSAEDMPQVAPSLVVPVVYNSTAINVTWTPVEETREKMRGKLIGYRIRYWPKKDNILYDPQALNYLSRSPQPHGLILGLQPNTYYYVQVMAYNAAGPGPASEPQFERTNKKAPQKPPTSVNVIALDPSTIVVTWRYVSPSVDEEGLSGYKVRIWEADQDLSTANDTIIPISNRKLEVTIGGLQPEKPYFLRVLAYSSGGDGKMSSPAKEFILALKSSGSYSRLSPLLILLWACIPLL
ncbi:unnamed protein product [Allacma fusca]|uniref:Contactin n=1 Tax=Allacma fusca TaxID=39272 RepID=A0A8J2KBR8_9HEXA|nr:unnamed protein product [Allacma fusca]